MAGAKVLLQDAEELKERLEEMVLEYERKEAMGEPTSLDLITEQIGPALEVVQYMPKLRDPKREAVVLMFCKLIMMAIGGENVRVSYELHGGFYGEMASVTVVGKSIRLNDLKAIKLFKECLCAIEISDKTDGTVELIFSFNGMMHLMNGGKTNE